MKTMPRMHALNGSALAGLMLLGLAACGGGGGSGSGSAGNGAGESDGTSGFTQASAPEPTLPPLPSGMEAVQWSQWTMDDGSAPRSDDVVVVPADTRLILDEDATIEGLIVLGEFFARDEGVDSPVQRSLRTGWAVAVNGGTFNIGWAESPYQGDLTVTLSGDNPDQDIDLGDYTDLDMTIRDNDAFLMAMGAGSELSIFVDDAQKRTWTQLARTAEAGADTVRLVENTGWEAGDVIALASTDFDLDQAEQRTITDVSDDGRTVTLDAPLEYMHYGGTHRYSNGERSWELDMRGEVGLLTRDVTFQGDENAAETQYGGNTMVMEGGAMYISGAEFTRMGQAGLIGRYPAHWHQSGDVSGQFIRESSFHRTFNKGLTIHNAQHAEVSNSVVFESIGHNYYVEEGGEFGNLLSGNLGMNARKPASAEAATVESDFDEPTNFWLKHPDNVVVGNHAAGSENKGFWIEGRARFNGTEIGLVAFRNNVAHSSVDRGLYFNHGRKIQDRDPEGSAERPQKIPPWTVERFTTYKNAGVYVRGIEGTFTDSVFAELESNARFRLNQTIRDSLIVGKSDNIGTPTTDEEIEAGRSLPRGERDFEGFQLYDGPSCLSGVMFDGFYGNNAIAIKLSNAIHKTSSFCLRDISWGPDVTEKNKFNLGPAGNGIGNDGWARGFVDIDGSVTGSAGAMIYQQSKDDDGSHSFNAGEDFEVIDEWGATVTYGQSSATLTVDSGGTAESNNGQNHGNPLNGSAVYRSDGKYATGLREQIPLFDGYSFELDYDSIDRDNFRLYLGDADWGQSFIVDLGPVPDTAGLTVDDPNSDAARPAREVSSMAMLEASPDTAVYRDDSGSVHVKLVAEMAHGYLWPTPPGVENNGLNSGVTVLVDLTAGVDPDNLAFDDPNGGEGLESAPVANLPEAVDFQLYLYSLTGNGDYVRIRDGQDLSGYDLSSGDYAFEVFASEQQVELLRVGANGAGVETANAYNGVFFDDGIRVDGDKLYVFAQAYSAADAEDGAILGSSVFELDL